MVCADLSAPTLLYSPGGGLLVGYKVEVLGRITWYKTLVGIQGNSNMSSPPSPLLTGTWGVYLTRRRGAPTCEGGWAHR
jgi:hypothetical protein